jgi:hypothetical protein
VLQECACYCAHVACLCVVLFFVVASIMWSSSLCGPLRCLPSFRFLRCASCLCVRMNDHHYELHLFLASIVCFDFFSVFIGLLSSSCASARILRLRWGVLCVRMGFAGALSLGLRTTTVVLSFLLRFEFLLLSLGPGCMVCVRNIRDDCVNVCGPTQLLCMLLFGLSSSSCSWCLVGFVSCASDWTVQCAYWVIGVHGCPSFASDCLFRSVWLVVRQERWLL